MTKYSLRARMMVLILAPTLLIGLLISTFFVAHRYHELEVQLVNSGASIIESLAVVSEYGLATDNRYVVRQLVNLLHRRHSDITRSIAVFDQENNLFAFSNHYQHSPQLLQLSSNVLPLHELMLTWVDNVLILRIPVTIENHYISGPRIEQMRGTPIGYIAIELDVKTLKLQQYKEIFISTLLLLLCLSLATLFAYQLTRDVTGPIRNMVSTVDRIRRGQLDSRVEGRMLSELNMLKNGINAMAMSLTTYHEGMQQNIDQATSELRNTLAQLEMQNVDLDLAEKKAQEAARIKSEFLANMSHELRTPLNGVIGFTRQTLKTSLTPTQLDYVHTIERSAQTLLSIINDLLDFSKLEAGKLILEHIPFPLRETIDEVLVLLAHTAHEKGLEITLYVNNDVPEHLLGDGFRLQQVLTNLLGNAIKFTENGNIDIYVEIRSRHDPSIELEVQIRDTGIGISERQQSQLFQAFRQADASISRRHGGSGLGLVITQKLVKQMGGEIHFHSQLNRGSTFWFYVTLEVDLSTTRENFPALDSLAGKRLGYIEANPAAAKAMLNMLSVAPLIVTHSTALGMLPRDQHYDILLVGLPTASYISMATHRDKLQTASTLADRIILLLPSQSQIDAEELKKLGVQACLNKPPASYRLFPLLLSTARPYSRNTAPHPVQRLPMTVMAVDDNPANLKLIGALLDEQVEKSLLCGSGKEAIALALNQELDVILMDIQMPDMDGIRASELIRQLPKHRHTPIIAVTAHVVVGERESLLKSMNDYLAKPIDEAMLAQILTRYNPLGNQWMMAAETSPPATAPYLHGVTDQSGTDKADVSLDWAAALQHSANKSDLARDLLQMLLAFLPQVTQAVQEVLKGRGEDEILNIIHKLHGSCSYSGVPRLKRLCQYIEQQLRQQVSPAELEPEWLELLDEMDNVTRLGNDHLNLG